MVIKIEKTEKMVTVAADPVQTKKKERVMMRKRCLKGLIKKVVEKTREDEKMVKVAANLSQIQIVTKMEKTEKMVTVAADPDQTKKKERVMMRKRCLKGLIKKVVKKTKEDEMMVKVAANLSQIQIVTKMEKTEKMVTVAADPDQIKKNEKMVKVAADLNQMVVKTSRVIRAVFKVFQNNKVNFRWAMFTRHASEEKIYSELVNF